MVGKNPLTGFRVRVLLSTHATGQVRVSKKPDPFWSGRVKTWTHRVFSGFTLKNLKKLAGFGFEHKILDGSGSGFMKNWTRSGRVSKNLNLLGFFRVI